MTESAEHPYYLEIAVKPLHRHKKTLRELGITECVIGGFSIFFAIIAAGIARGETARYIMLPHTPDHTQYKHLYAKASYSYTCSGIWCGIFLILSGYISMRIRVKPSRCIYVTSMAIAIITAFVNAVGAALSSVISAISSYVVGLTILHAFIGLLCFVGMVIAIIHSAFCCNGVCYNNDLAARQQLMYAPLEDIELSQSQYLPSPGGKLVMRTTSSTTSEDSSKLLTSPSDYNEPAGSNMTTVTA